MEEKCGYFIIMNTPRVCGTDVEPCLIGFPFGSAHLNYLQLSLYRRTSKL